MSAADAEDIAVFLEEAGELLVDFEQCLLLLESLPDDAEVLNRAFRCAHTIKGGAGMVGFEALQAFTHQLENLLDRLRESGALCTRPVIDALLASSDVIKGFLDRVEHGSNEPAAGEAEALAKIAAVMGPSADSGEVDLSSTAPAAPSGEVDLSAVTPASSTGEVDLSSVSPSTQLAPAPVAPAPARAVSPAPQASKPAAPAPPSQPVVMPPVAAIAAPPSAPTARASGPEPRASSPDGRRSGDENSATIRVPLQKIDRLVNLVGELVIAQSMVSQEVELFSPQRLNLLQDAVGQLDRHCRELQEQVLGIRMIPVKSMFDRFHRVVRDLSGSTGKQVALELQGEETELDKTVIEKIADPLTHLVRNAIDHGLEPAAERLAHGKPAQGTLTLSAYQRGGSIFIEVSDDGRGLDRDKILAKARKQGLVGEADKLSDDEINTLIFRPGFSTAEHVTELSGRGVGMDVVRRNVEELKGKIAIETVAGQSTRFRIQLPLTLAMIEGLALRVGREVFLMPLLSVAGSFKPRPSQLATVGESSEVVEVREHYVPLIRLHEVLKQAGAETNPCKGIVVVVDDGEQTFGVLADELLGQQQVVVKSLETNFRRVPGISGATVLGDGRVALIVDVGGLFELGQKDLRRAQRAKALPLIATTGPQREGIA